MNTLKEARLEKNLTQKEVADRIGISLRSYISYEREAEKQNTPKYRFLMQEIQKMNLLDEEHGILELSDIKSICSAVFEQYNIQFCYLFGSYAKGNATETSDIDLLVATSVSGMKFFGIAENLRTKLGKKIDLLDFNQLNGNPELLNNILGEGIRIYVQNKGKT